MKKLKKILSICACCLILVVSSFALTACSIGDVEQTVEKSIDTTSSIIPVELNENAARGILTTAIKNHLSAKDFKTESKFLSRSGATTGVTVATTNNDGDRFIYHYDGTNKVSVGEFTVSGSSTKQYLQLNMDTKKYSSASVNTFGDIICDEFMNYLLDMNLYGTYTAARYYDGFYHLTFNEIPEESKFEDNGSSGSSFVSPQIMTVTEIVISKDGYFAGLNITHYTVSSGDVYDTSLNSIIDFEITYTNVDTSMVVTSLTGYTAQA